MEARLFKTESCMILCCKKHVSQSKTNELLLYTYIFPNSSNMTTTHPLYFIIFQASRVDATLRSHFLPFSGLKGSAFPPGTGGLMGTEERSALVWALQAIALVLDRALRRFVDSGKKVSNGYFFYNRISRGTARTS